MSYNLVIWRWSDEYADKNRRRREGLTHAGVARDFLRDGDHPAMGNFEQESFLAEVNVAFPDGGLPDGLFVVERYPKAVVFNYGAGERFRVVPFLGRLAAKRGLNSTEA